MILVTVGTLFPFDRLIRAVDAAAGAGLLKEEVFAQVGRNGIRPKYIRYVEMLNKDVFKRYAESATCLISHAGIGSICLALSMSKPLLVMPRMKQFHEHVNDHQVATARKFEQMGYLLVAYTAEEIPDKIKLLKDFVPKNRQSQADVVAGRVAEFLRDVSNMNG